MKFLNCIVFILVLSGNLFANENAAKVGQEINIDLIAKIIGTWGELIPSRYSINYTDAFTFEMHPEAEGLSTLQNKKIATKCKVDGPKISFEAKSLETDHPMTSALKYDGETYFMMLDTVMRTTTDPIKAANDIRSCWASIPLFVPFRFLTFVDYPRQGQDFVSLKSDLIVDFFKHVSSITEETRDGKEIIVLNAKIGDASWIILLDKNRGFYPFYSEYNKPQSRNILHVTRYEQLTDSTQIVPMQYLCEQYVNGRLGPSSHVTVEGDYKFNMPVEKEFFEPLINSIAQVIDLDLGVSVHTNILNK